ncbi:MAG: hypothetical protein KAI24_05200 [Planctomycetes bacterium]|nr:hypothetical protein [Planctomycetota bacterium]
MQPFILRLATAVAGLAAFSPAQWITNPANGSQYRLLPATTWHQAQATAQSLGAHLAVIDDAAENQWIVNNLLLLPSFIGGTDAALEGTWTTPSGAPLAYTNWAPNQPDNFQGSEDYLEMWPGGPNFPAGVWNDADGQLMRPAIIERDPPLVAETFSAGSLDPAIWGTVTQGIPFGTPSVAVVNGACRLQDRGYLHTVQSLDTRVIGAYQVELTWRAQAADDVVRTMLRSDAVPTPAFGDVANGVGASQA